MPRITGLSTLLFAGLLCGTPALAFDGVQPPLATALTVQVAGDVGPSKNFIDGMAKTAIGFLGEEGLSEEQRKQEFRKLLHGSFDMKTIGRFALGTHWKAATPAQQGEYLKLFEAMVVKVYSQRFSEYNNQALEIGEAAPEGKDVMVTSYIVPQDGGEKVRVDWRVRNQGGAYKIVDVVVEGVSMALTQRSDFASVIQRGGGNLEVLLEHLRK